MGALRAGKDLGDGMNGFGGGLLRQGPWGQRPTGPGPAGLFGAQGRPFGIPQRPPMFGMRPPGRPPMPTGFAQRRGPMSPPTQQGGGTADGQSGYGSVPGAPSGIGTLGIGSGGRGAIGAAGGLLGMPGMGTVMGLAGSQNSNQALANWGIGLASLLAPQVALPLSIAKGLGLFNGFGGTDNPNSDAMASQANAISASHGLDPLDALLGVMGEASFGDMVGGQGGGFGTDGFGGMDGGGFAW